MLILLAVFPVVSAAVEIAFSDAVIGPAASRQFAPAIASNGDGYLVVWSDQRSGLETYAARVSHNGELLDPTGIRLGAAMSNERAVVWTGSEWLIVWNTPDGRLWESRVTREGVVRHDARQLAERLQSPRVVQAGAHTVIGYSSMDHPFVPRAMFVDGAGRIVNDLALASGDAQRQAPSVAWNGAQLVAVWAVGPRPDDVTIEGVRLSVSGLIDATPRPIVSDGAPLDPRIASDGSNFLLVTRDNFTRIDSARRLSADLGTVGAAVDLPSGGIDRTTLLWNASRYVVLSEDGASISAFRLDASGVAIDAQPVVLASTNGAGTAAPVAAAAGAELFVAWVGVDDPAAAEENFDIYGATVSPSLTAGARRLLSASAAAQTDPRIVSSGRTILALWKEGSSLFLRRVTSDGEPVDATPVLLSSTAGDVSAAFDGTKYFVAWIDVTGSELMTMQVSEREPVDARAAWRREAASPIAVAAASDGGTTIVSWVSGGVLQLAGVVSEGKVSEAPPLVLAEGSIESLAATGSAGGGFLVTWGDAAISEAGSAFPSGIRGAVVSAELVVTSFPGFEVVDTADEEGAPALAWNGREWLVVWERSILNRKELRARRITRDGWPIDGTPRDEGILVAAHARSPQVVWDGSSYTFSWRGTGASSRAHFGSMADLAGVITNAIDAGEVAAAPALSVVGRERVASAYSRIAREAAYGGVARAFLQVPEGQQGRRRSVR